MKGGNLSMKIFQTEDELKDQLKDQIDFLVKSSKAYDEGLTSEAKRLATVIRILLHDTQNSTSLLTLFLKKDMLFYDTSLDYGQNKLLLTPGLLMLKMGSSGGEYVPPLGNGPPTRYCRGKIPFTQWWNKIVLIDNKGNKLTRKDLVLTVCNKDGGAHVDPKLDEAYYALSRSNSLGWKYIKNGVKKDFANRPELASIRQISYEVLKSLKDEFPEYFKTE